MYTYFVEQQGCFKLKNVELGLTAHRLGLGRVGRMYLFVVKRLFAHARPVFNANFKLHFFRSYLQNVPEGYNTTSNNSYLVI